MNLNKGQLEMKWTIKIREIYRNHQIKKEFKRQEKEFKRQEKE